VKLDRARLKNAAQEVTRIALWPAILWIAYLIAAAAFAAVTERRGLISPDGVELGLLLLGATTLALRIAALFVLPAVVAYRAAARLLRPRAESGDEPRSGA
jgi:hypothetical protein